MRSKRNYAAALSVLIASLFVGGLALGADEVVLQFKTSGTQAEVAWRAQLNLPVSATFPAYTILRSVDARTWEPVAGPINGRVGVSDEALRVAVPLAGDHAFYRVVANIQPAGDGNFGDAIYGYGTAFSREIQRLGQLPLADFVALYGPTNQYLPGISFDPTNAQFWPEFNLRLPLNTNEFAVFQTNGFVVSPRLGSYSFADSFYTIFSADLPVFFSADAALQAWHRSYIAMLEEIEETFLSPWLQYTLARMSDKVPALWSQAQGTALVDGVLDADYFLAVAQSLLTGTNNYGHLGQTAQIQNALTAISNVQPAEIVMFGTDRIVDFSQFQVRGHYETSQRLQRYFRAMMWCGLIDFRFSGFQFTSPTPVDNSLRELSGAIAMNLLVSRSGMLDAWLLMDQAIQMFVGTSDSMNFAQFGDLLTAAGISSPWNVPNTAALTNLQGRIMSGQLGVQNIRSGYFWSPLSREQIKLPRSFTVMGQRFILDGWAHSQCVFDSVIWDEDGIPGFEDKVMRRVPSALDIAFSVLGNNQIVPDIAARIVRTNLTLADGRAYFRDGLKYQHNLAAVRNVMDSQGPAAWTNNIYTSWLACLRELSAPTTDPQYPQAMRTRAWVMKTLNTQLASWTQLRHDTVLYAKQPYTGEIVCSYPDGYVEPRPAFWTKMKEMALRTKALVSRLPDYGIEPPYDDFVFEPNWPDTAFAVSLGSIWTNRVQFLDSFATTMAMLQTISEKELARLPLSTNEVAFMRSVVEDQSVSYIHVKTFSGWYPNLFYLTARGRRSVEQSSSFSPSVA